MNDQIYLLRKKIEKLEHIPVNRPFRTNPITEEKKHQKIVKLREQIAELYRK